MEPKKLESTTAYKLTTNTEDSDVYIHNDKFGCGGDEVQVYLKSEADEFIESLKTYYKDAHGKLHTVNLIEDELYQKLLHAKYKRCIASAAYWAAVRYNCVDDKHKIRAENNHKKWLELSKRYKEPKVIYDWRTNEI